jgi:hypothetical protein
MKNKTEVKEFVQQHAEIKELKPVGDPNIRLDEDQEDTVMYRGELIKLTAKENPTLGFKFLKLKDRFAVCEIGCGEIVANQVIEKRLGLHPQRHWKTRCATCNKYLSPDGTSIITNSSAIQQAYVKYFAEKKRTE